MADDYSKTTDFAIKDTLNSGNPAKLGRGTEVDAEFNNLQTAFPFKEEKANKGVPTGYCPLGPEDPTPVVPDEYLFPSDEDRAGIIEVATQVETDDGLSDDRTVTPLKLTSFMGTLGLSPPGSDPVFGDITVDSLTLSDTGASNIDNLKEINITPGNNLEITGGSIFLDNDEAFGFNDFGVGGTKRIFAFMGTDDVVYVGVPANAMVFSPLTFLVDAPVNLAGTLDTVGAATFDDTATFDGAVTCTSTLTVADAYTDQKDVAYLRPTIEAVTAPVVISGSEVNRVGIITADAAITLDQSPPGTWVQFICTHSGAVTIGKGDISTLVLMETDAATTITTSITVEAGAVCTALWNDTAEVIVYGSNLLET
jgi:hypothetical protein